MRGIVVTLSRSLHKFRWCWGDAISSSHTNLPTLTHALQYRTEWNLNIIWLHVAETNSGQFRGMKWCIPGMHLMYDPPFWKPLTAIIWLKYCRNVLHGRLKVECVRKKNIIILCFSISVKDCMNERILRKSMQMGKQTDLILSDFSKAFDKVAHEKLISKLHFYGIRGKTLSWVKDFLDSRSQAVVLNGVKSDKIAVSSGVPQGSVLGPILFLAYINDLPDQVKSRVRLFADDTAIYLAINSEGESTILQNDLHTLGIWEKRWDMSFNPSKCQVLHITRAKCPIQTRYILHGTVLESVPSAKYLGVTISDNLSWTPTLIQSPKKQTKHKGF